MSEAWSGVEHFEADFKFVSNLGKALTSDAEAIASSDFPKSRLVDYVTSVQTAVTSAVEQNIGKLGCDKRSRFLDAHIAKYWKALEVQVASVASQCVLDSFCIVLHT